MALNINGTTGISGVDGSASAPALTGTDSNTGINFASDTVNINTGGSTRVIVDSSGNLRAGTITDTSANNSSTTEQIAQGRAKMWVNFNGTGTVAIRDSFNVSSVTDAGTGLYGVNFSTNMPNGNYCSVSAGNTGGGAGSKSVYVNSTDANQTYIVSYDNGGSQQDRSIICVASFADP